MAENSPSSNEDEKLVRPVYKPPKLIYRTYRICNSNLFKIGKAGETSAQVRKVVFGSLPRMKKVSVKYACKTKYRERAYFKEDNSKIQHSNADE